MCDISLFCNDLPYTWYDRDVLKVELTAFGFIQ